MFYSTLCLKVGAYFQNVFELNTAEHKLLGFTIPHEEADSAIKIAQTGFLAKQIGILFVCFWIMTRIREYRACFILHSA